jgi:hypothetical protein
MLALITKVTFHEIWRHGNKAESTFLKLWRLTNGARHGGSLQILLLVQGSTRSIISPALTWSLFSPFPVMSQVSSAVVKCTSYCWVSVRWDKISGTKATLLIAQWNSPLPTRVTHTECSVRAGTCPCSLQPGDMLIPLDHFHHMKAIFLFSFKYTVVLVKDFSPLPIFFLMKPHLGFQVSSITITIPCTLIFEQGIYSLTKEY